MKHLVMLLGLTVALVCLPLSASADWYDDFDSYAAGSGMNGQGGWECWDNDPGADALVTDLVSNSAPNSLDVLPTSDIIHQFYDYSAGCWMITAWQFIPDTFMGETYFILLNTYAHGGDYNWSLQVLFSSDGYVESQNEGAQLPLILNEWVEFRVEINLVTDIQRIYYGGQLLSEKSWVDGVSGGGAVNIACVDLYGNNADSVYYDDMSLEPMAPTPVESSTWGQIKATFK